MKNTHTRFDITYCIKSFQGTYFLSCKYLQDTSIHQVFFISYCFILAFKLLSKYFSLQPFSPKDAVYLLFGQFNRSRLWQFPKGKLSIFSSADHFKIIIIIIIIIIIYFYINKYQLFRTLFKIFLKKIFVVNFLHSTSIP